MNYLPFTGGWFYGAGLITGEKIAAFYCSWGLLEVAPVPTPPISGIRSAIRFLLYKITKGGRI